jgi:hypothetical protein
MHALFLCVFILHYFGTGIFSLQNMQTATPSIEIKKEAPLHLL